MHTDFLRLTKSLGNVKCKITFFVISGCLKMNFARVVEILELIYFKILDMLLFLLCSLYNYADTVNIS